MEVNGSVKLVANDKSVHEVSLQAAKRSKFICDLMADFKDKEIQVAEANGPILKEIIEYLEHYKDTEPREISKPIEEDQRLPDLCEKWDVDFAERSEDLLRLQDLVVAADYMGIDSLHELMVVKLACIMLDLGTTEAIIKHFNIEEDVTEEEALQMEKDELIELRRQRDENTKLRKAKEEEEKKNEGEKTEGVKTEVKEDNK